MFIACSLLIVSCDTQENTEPPPPTTMSEEEFTALSEKAYAYLDEKQALAIEQFDLESYERYDWDQEKGELVWSDNGVPKVIADIQFVGSVSTKSKTWLWSWANSTVLDPLSRDIHEVQSFGQAHGIRKLTDEKWPADEVDGWEMTAIAAYVLNALGAYRSPDDDGFTYMVFTRLRFAPGQGPEPDGETEDSEAP